MKHMYFHGSVENYILFEGWKTTNWWELLLSCLAVILISLSYEGIKLLRFVITQRAQGQQYDPEKAAVLNETPHHTRATSLLSCTHLLHTFLYACQLVISFFLMLIIMTFNVYLCFSVLLGAVIGYLFLAWKTNAEFSSMLH